MYLAKPLLAIAALVLTLPAAAQEKPDPLDGVTAENADAYCAATTLYVASDQQEPTYLGDDEVSIFLTENRQGEISLRQIAHNSGSGWTFSVDVSTAGTTTMAFLATSGQVEFLYDADGQQDVPRSPIHAVVEPFARDRVNFLYGTYENCLIGMVAVEKIRAPGQ